MSALERAIEDQRRADEAAAAVDADAPMPLPAELLPVPPFPLDALPGAVRRWTQDVAERIGCPPEFVAVPQLGAASMLVARTGVRLRPKALDDWGVVSNLWAAVVGRPGTKKSPAMSEALAPLRRLEAVALEEYTQSMRDRETDSAVAAIRKSVKTANARKAAEGASDADLRAMLEDDAIDEVPTRRRYTVTDATYEALGKVMGENPGGVMLVRDELNGWLASLSGEENTTARTFVLSAWSGGPTSFDRITREAVSIEDARLSVCGGIQPGPLQDLFGRTRRTGQDDGLIERFLIAWPDSRPPAPTVDRDVDHEARQVVGAMFDRLDTLTPYALGAMRDADMMGGAYGPHYVRFTDEACQRFKAWHDANALEAYHAQEMEAALSKFPTHAAALALVLHAMDGGTGPVGLAALDGALTLCAYFKAHARRLYEGGQGRTVDAARRIAEKAAKGDLPESFRAREVYRRGWQGLSDRDTVREALELLDDHRWVIAETTDGNGRPSTAYRLTPATLAMLRRGKKCGTAPGEEPTKPTEPPFGGFGSDHPGVFEEIHCGSETP
jgi:putative DNA primase/helicase